MCRVHGYIWDKVFESGLSKFCGGQSSKNVKRYGLPHLKIPDYV